jgi:hypothetical protein
MRGVETISGGGGAIFRGETVAQAAGVDGPVLEEDGLAPVLMAA